MSLLYTAHATATPGLHTPDAALDAAMTWLARTPTGFADCVLLTMPGRLYRAQEIALYDEIQRVLPDNKPLFIWGNAAGLLGSAWQTRLIAGDLALCYQWDRPALKADQILPAVGSSREFPPALVEWCIKSSCGERSVILDIFPRASHVAIAVAAAVGAHCLSVGPIVDQHIQQQSSVPCPSWAKSPAFADEFRGRLVRAGKCLIYRGQPNADGYARMRVFGQELYCHRIAFMIEHRSGLPPGVPVLHASCEDKRCCDPAHLRLGTVDNNLAERWLNRRK